MLFDERTGRPAHLIKKKRDEPHGPSLPSPTRALTYTIVRGRGLSLSAKSAFASPAEETS